ncbi:MAG: hypothetical protein ACD_52C00026G0006 [uncultured bacterium]|uniref:Helicase HerA central domain-containing protein n=1 Tax=Candidatus Woesebacteria bacterium RIFCSPHIGHO2_12_FULL_41_24 TaxID=1802510 RepID=A0A1F8AU10_9BACT|nr:MAG: hypothetical protein ACD_52C00026G0006 [uncultured bacterium]OGM14160.1 MAG: hypothetical protein A2W15_03775 [Candidatus Woesebacteria bacterium RBG_16_41_13]OGM28555.1 MAG: hypothetical protein A2873_02845 [Candidatus Woesebacteria bacterium RIFCSPHIGHO2_01_FULL_42_80]OGM35623.1 MAG: hypothetical protein A3D84_03625 [Candidatus Woesebacteria bacterium RIFCSPHIGHO2_02_FULL_42_20]OGM55234.1 MAG: hypothetical protein A3E44_03035 [Candidatus Woesebacteria bacterium RIFCSPHIGHO2_12_FULL_41
MSKYLDQIRNVQERNVLLLGISGTGKSNLLGKLINSNIKVKEPFILFDFDGNLSEKTEHSMKLSNYDKYYAEDLEKSVSFYLDKNVLEGNVYDLVLGIIELVNKLLDPEKKGLVGPKCEKGIDVITRTLVEVGKFDLYKAFWLLYDLDNGGKEVRKYLDSPKLKHYKEALEKLLQERTGGEFHIDYLNYVEEKMFKKVDSPYIKKLLTYPYKKSVRDTFKKGRSLILDFSKQKTDEEVSIILGNLFMLAVLLTLRTRQPGKNYVIYINGLQNISSRTFSSLMMESRPLKITIIPTLEYLQQINRDEIDAILGNTAALILFKTNDYDADFLEGYFNYKGLAKQLPKLKKGQAILVSRLPGKEIKQRVNVV